MTLVLLQIQRLVPEGQELGWAAIRIAIGIAIAFVFQRLAFLVVGRGERWLRAGRDEHTRQRAMAIGQTLRNLITVLVVVAVGIHVLAVAGWDVRPLLTGAGLLTAALGFGAQTLIRDLIAGIFIISEGQLGVDDLVEINGRVATVEALGVRCTTLRDFNGHVHYVPNGEMKTVINRSRGWHRMAVDVPVAADADGMRALEVCSQVASQMGDDPTWRPRLLDPIEVWGVEALGPQSLQVRLVLRGRPGPDIPETARELRLRLNGALNKAGIRPASSSDIGIQPLAPTEVRPAEATLTQSL